MAAHLWRAVDQHGNVLDVLVQSRRNAKAAKRFFRKLLKGLSICRGGGDRQLALGRGCSPPAHAVGGRHRAGLSAAVSAVGRAAMTMPAPSR